VAGGAERVVRVELGDAVTAALREMILAGELAAGTRLVETELAARFGTSRGPVRDALAELERSGLVRSEDRRGSYVCTVDVDDVDELYSLRLALEQLAVARAVPRCGVDDLAAMEAALAELASALVAGDVRAAAEADLRFHRTIVERAEHRRLADAWERLAGQVLFLMRELAAVSPTVLSDVGAHRELLDAFVAGDAPAAVAALTGHLEAARISVRQRFAPASWPSADRALG
jgi:DNA-binding GntR family transcriptional regulator